MKKLLILTIVLSFVLIGCQTNSNNDIMAQHDNNLPNTTATSLQTNTANNMSIIIRSVDHIDYIKSILEAKDETELVDGLLSLEGAGSRTKEDLFRFLELVNILPIVDLIEGEISAISYSKGLAEDTGKEYEFAYISVKANDGSWVRFEYLLNEEKAAAANDKISSTEQGITVFSKPVQSLDGRIIVFSEQSKDHSSGMGKLFTWNTNIDGTNTKIIYYAKNQDQINTASAFSGVSILKLYEEDESK